MAPVEKENSQPSKFSVEKIVAWASIAYAGGFLTVLLHTARLGLPVIELVKPIYIWIGLPLAAVAFFLRTIALWIRSRAEELLAEFSAVTRPGKADVHVGYVGWGGPLPIQIKVTGFFGTILRWFLWATEVYSITARLLRFVMIVICLGAVVYGYVWLVYPALPFSLGGGAPATVRLVLSDEKAAESLGELLGRPQSVAGGSSGDEKQNLTDSVCLLYGTSSELFVRTKAGRTISVDRDAIAGIIWEDHGLTFSSGGSLGSGASLCSAPLTRPLN